MTRKLTNPRSTWCTRNSSSTNCINHHEENISSTVKAATCRSDQICQRLEQFQRSFEKETKQDERVQWICNQKKINSQVDVSLKSLDGLTKGLFQSFMNNNSNRSSSCLYTPSQDIAMMKDDELCLQDDSKVTVESHRLHWKVRTFVMEVCGRKCNDEKYLEHCYRMQKHLLHEMQEEYELLESSQSKLEEEIRIYKDSCMNQRSFEDVQLQTRKRNALKERRYFKEICEFSRSIDLIDDIIYHDLIDKVEMMIDLNEDTSKSTTDDSKNIDQSTERNNSLLHNEHHIIWESEGNPTQHLKQSNLTNKVLLKKKNDSAANNMCRDHVAGQQCRFKKKNKITFKQNMNHQGIDVKKQLNWDEQVVERIWHYTISHAIGTLLEDEYQFRLNLGRKLKKCASDVKLDASKRQRIKEEERRRTVQLQKDQDRVDAKVKLEQHKFLKVIEQIELDKAEEARVCREEEAMYERSVKNEKR